MVHPNFPFWRSVGMLVGAIVGAGVFGLPYAFAQSGYALGAVLVILLGLCLLVLQLMFAQVVVQTPGKHHVIGYMQMYLGKRWARLATICLTISIWGAMLAYLIIGGTFLQTLFSPVLGGSLLPYALVLFAFAAFFIYRGLRCASKMEIGIIFVLLFLFLFIMAAAAPEIEFSHLTTFRLENGLIPYGVALFAFGLGGVGIIPDLKLVLGEKKMSLLPHVVVTAFFIVLVLYAGFPLAVLGVTGEATTQAALEGLGLRLGTFFTFIASLLGSLAIFSIFLVLGIQLLDAFKLDFKLSHRKAWLLVVIVPLLLFLAGMRNFIEIIGFIGVFLMATLGASYIFTYEKMRNSAACFSPHSCLQVPRWISWAMVLLFAFGMLAHLWVRLG